MKTKLLAILTATAIVASLFALTACQATEASSDSADTSGANSAESAVRTISSDEALQMMEDETGYVILDVRNPDEFSSGHIPDAINIPVTSLTSSSLEGIAEKDQLIMVYCRSGNRSATAAKQLVDMGYTNVVDFGGIINWTGDVV